MAPRYEVSLGVLFLWVYDFTLPVSLKARDCLDVAEVWMDTRRLAWKHCCQSRIREIHWIGEDFCDIKKCVSEVKLSKHSLVFLPINSLFDHSPTESRLNMENRANVHRVSCLIKNIKPSPEGSETKWWGKIKRFTLSVQSAFHSLLGITIFLKRSRNNECYESGKFGCWCVTWHPIGVWMHTKQQLCKPIEIEAENRV